MHGQPSADTVALPGADSRSGRFRCGGRESKILAAASLSTVMVTAALFVSTVDAPAAPAPSPEETQRPASPAIAGQGHTSAKPTEVPKHGAAVRISGDAKLQPVRTKEGGYTLPGTTLNITSALPDGYPAPTPPSVIELKTYPSVRRAEYTVAGEPGAAMFKSFRPLYNHISGRKIPMTSPVEMDFPPSADKAEKREEKKEGGPQPPVWKVSFLYRTKELGPKGNDGKVSVVDTAQVTVISIGVQSLIVGPESVVDEQAALRKCLASQEKWEQAGDLRSLGYTGPGEEPWSELQLPVRPKNADKDNPAAEANPNPKASPQQPIDPHGAS